LEGFCQQHEFASAEPIHASATFMIFCGSFSQYCAPIVVLQLALLPSLSFPVGRVAFEAARWYEQPGVYSIARRVSVKSKGTSKIPPKQSVGGRESFLAKSPLSLSPLSLSPHLPSPLVHTSIYLNDSNVLFNPSAAVTGIFSIQSVSTFVYNAHYIYV